MANNLEEKRLEIQNKLEEIIGIEDRVYFQTPESFKMTYPCFRFERVVGDHMYANNMTYRFTPQYEITYMSRDPSPSIVEDVVNSFSMIRYNRHYVIDNIYHDVFVLYK